MEVTGPSDYVEKKIDEFLKRSPALSLSQSVAHAVPHGVTAPAAAAAKLMSPAQFFNSVNPKSDVDRVLVSAYYLEKYRQSQNATAAEIKELIREAKRPAPANASEAINQNIRKGFLMSGGDREGKIAFVVTSDGESQAEAMAKKDRA